ncbi:MAG: caspase domain-containing protein [Crocinitomicaceae bacterium]
MRKALIVGINSYIEEGIPNLSGTHNDVDRIGSLLKYHTGCDGEQNRPNFNCKVMKCKPLDEESSQEEIEKGITRAKLQGEIRNLFEDDESDIALLYFSGHGYENSLGGYLVTQDAKQYQQGVSFNDIMIYANNSSIKEIIIILDCCRSGSLSYMPMVKHPMSTLRKGVSILTSSNSEQESLEFKKQGVFTNLICNALSGGNTDILGNVKLTHLYEHVDKMLGPWDQRPTFKSNSSRLSVLRKVKPKIDYATLKRITKHFKSSRWSYRLDPSYDADFKLGHTHNERIMKDLRQYYRLGLLYTTDVEYMYHAAEGYHSCKLTDVGRLYWKLVKNECI